MGHLKKVPATIIPFENNSTETCTADDFKIQQHDIETKNTETQSDVIDVSIDNTGEGKEFSGAPNKCMAPVRGCKRQNHETISNNSKLINAKTSTWLNNYSDWKEEEM